MAIKFPSALDVLKNEAEIPENAGGYIESTSFSTVLPKKEACDQKIGRSCIDEIAENTAAMWLDWSNDRGR